jgi:hypothetical protein
MIRQLQMLCVAALAACAFTVPARADSITCTSVCEFGPGDVIDNLYVKNGGCAKLKGATVNGNIVVEDGGKLFIRNDVHVEGNIQIENAARVDVRDATVGGSVQIKQSSKVKIKDLVIEGDLQILNNHLVRGTAQIKSNVVGGNLQIFDNSGLPIIVTKNEVEGALQCGDNSSMVVGVHNESGDLECDCLH